MLAGLATVLKTQDNLFLLINLIIVENVKKLENYDSLLFCLLYYCDLSQYEICYKELQIAVFYLYGKRKFLFFQIA